MQSTIISYVGIILIILLLVMLAQKLRVAYPIVLVLGGLVISLIPHIPTVEVDPEIVFVIFLPPLLYEAAWFTSWKDLWKWRRIITSFAFIVVIITSLLVAVVSSTLIPGFTLALGFLLGGIVSPPDAVSATSIMKYVKVPRRFTAIVEGESLLNDAASLIVFRFALIAVDTGHFVFHKAALSFVLVVLMGVVVGLVIAMLYYYIHKYLPTNSNIDIVLTLTAPYVMYIVAEQFHVSGVLSVVTGGLFLSSKNHVILRPNSRIQANNVWSSLSFVLNGLVFMLIGLELPVIIQQLGDVSVKSAIGYGVLITAVLIVGRILCTYGSVAFTMFISRYITTADSRPGWKAPILLGWTGMRGVVSLAAALSVPLYLTSGAAFPQRNLILFITFTVILLTLVLQGLTLPLLIKWVNMEDPDHYPEVAKLDILTRKKLAEKSLQFLEEQHQEVIKNNKALQQLKTKLESDILHSVNHGEADEEIFKQVYLQVLAKQRELLHEWNKKEEVDEAIIRKNQELIDFEEEAFKMRVQKIHR